MSNNKGDLLSSLPIDAIDQDNNADFDILKSLFIDEKTSRRNMMNVFTNEMRDPFIAAILFTVMSSQTVDQLIRRSIKITNKSPIILLLSKFIFVMSLFWILKNISLVRTKS